MNDYYTLSVRTPYDLREKILFEMEVGYRKTENLYTSYSVMAAIDTGADKSCISRRLAKEFNLQPSKTVQCISIDGVYTAFLYENIDFIFPDGKIFNIQTADCFGGYGYDIIIGMDILNRGDMAITNAEDKTVFSFRTPSAQNHIDFVKEKKLLNQHICPYCGKSI